MSVCLIQTLHPDVFMYKHINWFVWNNVRQEMKQLTSALEEEKRIRLSLQVRSMVGELTINMYMCFYYKE